MLTPAIMLDWTLESSWLRKSYADRARERANCKECIEVMLGRVMAHEMGHLLLGKHSHSAAGIMHTPWRSQDMKPHTEGMMRFLPGEAKRIRERLVARSWSAAAIRWVESDPKLTVLIYNYAHVSDKALDLSEKTASEVFERAGGNWRVSHVPGGGRRESRGSSRSFPVARTAP